MISVTTEPVSDSRSKNETRQSGTTHLAYLDGLRAYAALSVLFFHANSPLFAWHSHEFHAISQCFEYILLSGREAVTLFIMLSGFCLALPVVKSDGILKGGAVRFYKRRAKRIIPPYYFSLLISCLLIITLIGHKTGAYWDECIPISAGGLLTHILLIQNLFQEYRSNINFPLWTVALEWQIYFLFPLILLLSRKVGYTRATAITCIFALIATFILEHYFKYYIVIQYVGVFAVGMLAAVVAYSPEPQYISLRRKPFGVSAIGAFVIYKIWTLFNSHLALPGDILFSAFAFCLLITGSRPLPNILAMVLSWKPLAFVGTFSYSIYLIHAPLLQVFNQYVFASIQNRDMMLFVATDCITIPFIVGIAYVFHLYFERPFMNIKVPSI